MQILFYNSRWYEAKHRPAFLDMEFFAYQHAFHYASAAFEGARCYPDLKKNDGSVNLVGIEMRLNRLFGSLEYAWLKIPPRPEGIWELFQKTCPELRKKYADIFRNPESRETFVEFRHTQSEVKDFILKTVLLNLGTGFIQPSQGCYVRPLVFRGTTPEKSLGVNSSRHSVDFLLMVKPWGKYLGETAFEKGTPLVVSGEGIAEYNRRHKLAANYLTGQRLVDFASYNHFMEILMTDTTPSRNVLEGSGENLVFYCGNNTFVSPAQEGKAILPGTTLKVIDRMIRALGGTIQYRDVPLEEVLSGTFKGAAMVGTAAEVTPIVLIFDPLTEKAGEIPLCAEIKTLQKTYLDLVQGLELDPRLQQLQEELLLPLKWNEKEHGGLLKSVLGS